MSQPSETRSSPVPANMRANGLWVFESRHAETFAMSVTRHTFLKLLWIREGRARIEFGDESQDCETGNLVIVPARTRHRIVDSPNTPVSLCGLGVNEKQLKSLSPVMPLFRCGVFAGPQMSTLRIEHQFRKLLYLVDQDDVASELSSVAVALELLAELALNLTSPSVDDQNRNRNRATNVTGRGSINEEPPDPMLEAYLDWLHRNFYEPLTLDDAAKSSGMSRRTFTSRFKARTGATWLEYVNSLRVRRAEELLLEADRKVTSIAFQCGFDDLSTFYRAFKRITGRTPGG
ncbi:AraC family transcriptional regulator [Aporhodopirellula rubra]|uniref:AraC family transcriptional regulator n=1 Tax=Aporhodopirellula rubra TaxID=980271 RepID=UPI0028F430C6|nr:AraC family transcriptional regulator [Aporhodopirellula rubra]